ncbi:hypothetical protein NL449_27330, partial [Klebsiella pneumoniae]|nr:hypothetical protein [Klebsiella pneumoniae]
DCKNVKSKSKNPQAVNVNFFSDRVLENIMSWNEKSKLTNRLWQLLEIPKKFCLLLTKRCRGVSP